MLGSVPTRPRTNPFRRRREAVPLLPDQIAAAAAAAKRPAESCTSAASSSFHSEVISTTTSSTTLAAAQRPEKRPRREDADEARPAASECSEVIGGATARAVEVEVSESSCLRSVLESDLACPEQLADDDDTVEYSSACEELTLSETDDEVLSGGRCPYAEYSVTPLHDSSSSDNAADAAPSPTFSLFLSFARQFVPCVHPNAHAVIGVDSFIMGKRFEDLDDEESYERFRRRERQGVVARDYTEVFAFMPDSYARDVVEQRVVMVNWIIEYSHVTQLQAETVFIGIGLMDRFLTRGYIKGARNIQLLGIACVTLATRIEENQPYNYILQKAFMVGANTFSRSEVVAMEWLVQEVLDFQCFVTTTRHFLWFYLKAAKTDDKVEELAKYLALISLMDPKQLSFWPSTVAAAVVALACIATDNESSCQLVMDTHMRSKNDDLPECLMSLEWLISYAS